MSGETYIPFGSVKEEEQSKEFEEYPHQATGPRLTTAAHRRPIVVKTLGSEPREVYGKMAHCHSHFTIVLSSLDDPEMHTPAILSPLLAPYKWSPISRWRHCQRVG